MRRDPLPAIAERRLWRAALALRFDAPARRTRLASVRHEGPLIVQRPLYPEGDDVCHAIVVHPPGGIAGGDELAIDVDVAAGAHAVLTTPGAGKLYKSGGARAVQHVSLRARGDAILEWLPQETIVFDAASASLSLDVDADAGALVMAWEIVALGRQASGETFGSGALATAIAVRIGGESVLHEAGRVDGGAAWLDSPVGWRGQRAGATFVVAGRLVDDALLDDCRASIAPWSTRAAVTRIERDCLVARYLGPDARDARAAFACVWSAVREALAGRRAMPLRIWAT